MRLDNHKVAHSCVPRRHFLETWAPTVGNRAVWGGARTLESTLRSRRSWPRKRGFHYNSCAEGNGNTLACRVATFQKPRHKSLETNKSPNRGLWRQRRSRQGPSLARVDASRCREATVSAR